MGRLGRPKREDIEDIINLYEGGMNFSEIADIKGVSRQRISQILHQELGLVELILTDYEVEALRDLLCDTKDYQNKLSHPLESILAKL